MTPYRRIRNRLDQERAQATPASGGKRKKARRPRRGVALVLVLGALVILTVFATELQERTASTMASAAAERDSLKAEYHARSSINLVRLLMATEPIVRKAVDPMFRIAMKSAAPQIPVWKFTSLVLGPFNDENHQEDFTRVTQVSPGAGKGFGLTTGYFEDPVVVEEDALINVNSASLGDPASVRELSRKLLGLFGQSVYNEYFEDPDADGQYSDPPTICSAILDWADIDEVMAPCDPLNEGKKASDSGEDNYYSTLGLKYQRKNAPYDSIDELRLVRGVSDDFWGNFVDPDLNDPTKRTLTVWGQGKVNVNAANEQTLLAVVCSGAPDAPVCNDVEQMSIFLTAMSLARTITQGAPIFKSPKAFVRAMQGKGKGVGPLFAALGLEPIEFQNARQVQRSITTESRVFSIYAEGVVPGRNRQTRARIHTVVDFRSANELGVAADEQAEGLGEAAGKAPKTTDEEDTASTTTDPTPEQLAAAAASDPMGIIIYHRLE